MLHGQHRVNPFKRVVSKEHLYGNSFYEIKDPNSDDPTTNIVDVPITDDSYKELFNYYPA